MSKRRSRPVYGEGRRFGMLAVVRHVGMDGAWRTYECKCDCGNVITASSKLLAAHKRSCGCLLNASRSNIGKRNAHDITGLRSGRLVALRRAYVAGARRPLWLCKCDCGNETHARVGQIKQGALVSCGCLHGKGASRVPHVREIGRRYLVNRRASDPKFVLAGRMSNQIRDALKGRKRGRSWQRLVGYTIDDLIKRLSETLPAGYSWDDFMDGRLHVDHIVPLAAHNFKEPCDPDFVRAFALTNLQFLPAGDNMRKSAKLAEPFQPSFAWGGQ